MPHCFLEYSNNVVDKPDFNAVFKDLHRSLASTGEFSVEDFKSRALCYEIFLIADGNPTQAFIALEISILQGRPDEQKQNFASIALKILERYFHKTISSNGCDISVRINEIHTPSYKKLKE